jgi:hypothetical protein
VRGAHVAGQERQFTKAGAHRNVCQLLLICTPVRKT